MCNAAATDDAAFATAAAAAVALLPMVVVHLCNLLVLPLDANGMLQPAVVALTPDEKCLYSWAIVPALMNLGGGSDRPVPSAIWKLLQERLARGHRRARTHTHPNTHTTRTHTTPRMHRHILIGV